MPPSRPPVDRLDLGVLLTTLRRRYRLFAAVLVATLIGGAIITARQVPVYAATSQVVVNTRQQQVAPTTAPTDASLPTPDVIATEVIVVQSRSLADRVATALDLDHDPAFLPRASSTGGIGMRIRKMLGAAPPPAAPIDPAILHQRAVDALGAGLSVARLDESYALQISFNSGNPALAAKIANEFARQYTHGQLSQKIADTRSTTDFLARRLEGLRVQAQADTERVERYRLAHNLLSTTGASLTEQEITSYNEQVATARAQAAEDQARLDTARAQLRAGSSGGDVGAALGSPVVSTLRGRRADVGGRLASLESRYGPLHPEVIKARSELQDVDAQIAAEIGRIISGLQAQARVSHERLASLTNSLSGAKGTLAENGQAAVGLDDLQRRATTSQALYETYLNRYKETGAQEGTERPDARIVSLAQVPAVPTSPHPTLNMILAGLIGTIGGLIAAFAAETMFAGLTTAADVEKRLGQPALGLVPAIRSVDPKQLSTAAAVLNAPESAFAESIRSLRREIQYSSIPSPMVIAITSALPKEGKTTLSVCLARSIAASGGRVVLVDCDLRQRGVSRWMEVAADRPGLVDLLRGDAQLEDVLLVDDASGAFMLPQPRAPGDVGDLLVGPAMDALLATLRDRFGHVILDTAPVLPIADTRVLAAKVDALVFAARWRKTSDHAVRAALRLLPERLVNIAGIVLTRVDMRRQANFAYGDASAYYGAYKGYYG